MRRLEKADVVIVVGSKSVNATGLIRSLGQAGYYVVFASTYSKIESKWTNEYLYLPKKKQDKIQFLLKYIKTLSTKPALFPTDDETAYLLDENYDKLREVCFFSHRGGKLRSIIDKTVMAQMASESGLNVPYYKKINLYNDIELDVEMPVILKPYTSIEGSKGDIRLCQTQEQLNKNLEELKKKGYEIVMVQHLLQHADQYEIGLMGLSLPDGTIEIPCTIRKIRSYPSKRGSTSFAQIKKGLEAVDENAVKRFVRQSGYVGIFDIEMIISNGKAYFIEINYRNGQYGYAPTAAGYNIPDNWIKGMKGEKIDSNLPIDEIYYMNERDDFRHVKSGEVSFVQWLKEFYATTAYGMYCPGDQRPYVRQYIKIPDRVKIFSKKIVDFMVREEWNIAYRNKQATLLYEEGGCDISFNILPNTFRYWAADPFVIEDNERDYIFFEMYDRFKQKGVIGYRVIENGKVSCMKVAYEAPTHLSFPFVFVYNDEFYMLPESANEKRLMLLKAESFPDKWVEVKSWMEGMKLCDSVILQNNDEAYLLTQKVDKDYSFDSLNIYSWEDEQWKECCNSPIVLGSANARLAGNIIKNGDALIRVSQDCEESYGKAINFNEIQLVTSQEYKEKLIARVEIEDVKYNRKKRYYDGIHTYNVNQNLEVVDLKKDKVFHAGNIFSYLYRLRRRRKINETTK